MGSAPYAITSSTGVLKPSFNILQFNVKNTNQYTIYIKISGQIASITDYDYIIQPNSNFYSPLIFNNAISYFTNATDFLNPAVITVYDHKVAESGNTPYLDNQNIAAVTNYPATVTTSISLNANWFLANLPQIVFPTFQMAYLIIEYVSGATILANDIGVPVFLVNKDANNIIIGACNPPLGDKIIAISPNLVGEIGNYALSCPLNSGVIFTVSIVFSNQTIFKPQTSKFPTLRSNGAISVGNLNFKSYLIPPAAIFNIYLQSSFGDTYNFSIKIQVFSQNGYFIDIIYNQSFAFTAASHSNVQLLTNFKYTYGEYSYLLIGLNNLATVNPFNIDIGVWEYVG